MDFKPFLRLRGFETDGIRTSWVFLPTSSPITGDLSGPLNALHIQAGDAPKLLIGPCHEP
jgi:hypothetical protein